MNSKRFIVWIALLAASLSVGFQESGAQSQPPGQSAGGESLKPVAGKMRAVTPAQRAAAAERAAAARSTTSQPISQRAKTIGQPAARRAAPPPVAALNPGGTPDYLGGLVPNYANSPIIPKFVDTLPGLGVANANNLGNYIPIANADTTTYPGSDYYQIGVMEYQQQLHTNLPPTRLRGYKDLSPLADANPYYLGPLIVAQKDKAVRIKFTNMLPTGAAGNLFLPVDTTVMGAGTGGLGTAEMYTQNRATLHLHGGDTPWISDGTPHQWVIPVGEVSSYPSGVSAHNVPDMPDPGSGSLTFYYPNQQSARMMFYHDHAYGMTRLNVYAGEAAGYLVTDPFEESLITTQGVIPDLGGVYHLGIPLIIQDKTFVDAANIVNQDPTWNWGTTAPTPHTGDLWFPHVYMPNQNPNDMMGVNAMGRWDYGPWFWPPLTTAAGLINGSVISNGLEVPGTPNPSIVPEAFLDTPVVNGAAYPVLPVTRRAYRFRVLNACNDRFLNLQLYYVDPANPTEVKMVPAVPHASTDLTWPATWPTDGRDGGVPDPTTAGPAIVQIGTEGGFLPAPVVLSNTPIGYIYNRRDITVLNVSNKTLFLGPAERADIIVDFSQVPDGSKIILYNDAPAPVPGFDPRNDYYTGNPDQTTTGGAPSTQIGFGPNIRTIMRFDVAGTAANPFVPGPVNSYDVAAFSALSPALSAAYAATQAAPLVPQAAYGTAFGTTFTNTYSRIQDTSLTYTAVGGTAPTTVPIQPKAIQELFELNYGRMNATMGVELPFTNMMTQTTIPYGYIDPPTEILQNNGLQIWKITHNGVDTHAIHVHLFNMQLVNRVGWDGMVKPPDPNELGWKETIRMNPLEDAIVAIKPVMPTLPFDLPDSIRPLDPTQPLGSMMGFMNIDPATGNPINVINQLINFGWEYVWHCHLLGHEENDMMRAVVFQVPPGAPTNVTATAGDTQAVVSFTAPTATGGSPILNYTVTSSPGSITATGAGSPITVSGLTNGTAYTFTVSATNAVGTGPASFASNSVTPTAPTSRPRSPNNLQSVQVGRDFVLMTWNDRSNNELGFFVVRSADGGRTWTAVGVTGANVNVYQDNGLTPNTRYRYMVQAYNSLGVSAFSNTLRVRTLP